MLSRRFFLQSVSATFGVGALSGCYSVADPTDNAVASTNAGLSVYVATTRKPLKDASDRPWFTGERSGAMRVVRASLSPADPSIIGRMSSVVSNRKTIATVEGIGSGDPLDELVGQCSGQDVLVYVHGYNESFETAVTGGAELSEGIGFRGATIVFTWPSKAGIFDYVYDRESALWSRDAFENLLEALSASSTIGRIFLVAHSMGTLLALESLRALVSKQGDGIATGFGAIVFASPDIDVDVFTANLIKIGALARKLTVISSTNDRALALSQSIAGGVTRVGGADRAVLEGLGVKVADASDYGGWGVLRHDLFLTNPEVRQVVRRAIERGA